MLTSVCNLGLLSLGGVWCVVVHMQIWPADILSHVQDAKILPLNVYRRRWTPGGRLTSCSAGGQLSGQCHPKPWLLALVRVALVVLTQPQLPIRRGMRGHEACQAS